MQPYHSAPQPAGRSKSIMFVIVVGLMLISILFIQQVIAQDNRPTLKSPFRLQTNRTAAPNFTVTPPPLTAPILMSQTFDNSYTYVTDPAAVGWHQIVGQGATHGYTWGRFQSVIALSNTVWSAATNPGGMPLLTAGSDTYTTGMQALLVYGPLDLSSYGATVLTATYLLDVQPSDSFGVAVSTDGTNFDILSTDSAANPTLDIAHYGVYNLTNYARRSGVWVAFYFTSTSNSNLGYGAFIESTALRAVPLQKSYLPVAVKQPTLTPTATPTQVASQFNYTFSNGSSSDSDFIKWGKKRNSDCSSDTLSCTYVQDILGSLGGNPPSAMTLYIDQINSTGGASPNQKAGTNYEYSADMYIYTGHKDARFGLIFAASDSTFSTSGAAFNPNLNYYLFRLKMSPTDATSVAYYQLQEIANGNVTNLISSTSLPTSLAIEQWNNFKVRHVGNTFTVFVNGVQLGSPVTRSVSWDTSRRKFGIYIATAGDNSGDPFEVFFDNVRVNQLP